ncbi:MAG: BON domain-containing protein [Vicinamibacterales bacterium]
MRTVAAALVLAAALTPLTGCGAATSTPSNDDATIATRVKIVLLDDPQTALSRLGVRVMNGVATLSGTVTSTAQEQRAVALAHTIRGVKDVKDEITVSGGGG